MFNFNVSECLILFMVGIICSALAYAIYVVNPLKMVIDNVSMTYYLIFNKS